MDAIHMSSPPGSPGSRPISPSTKPSLVGWFKNLTQLKLSDSIDQLGAFIHAPDGSNTLDAALTPTAERFSGEWLVPPRASPIKVRLRRNSHHRGFSFSRDRDLDAEGEGPVSPARRADSPSSQEHRLLRPIMSRRSRSSSNVKQTTDLERLREQRESFIETLKVTSHVFGVPLEESVLVAGVGISLQALLPGEPIMYGSIPMVVANCGRFLKKRALEVEGIFRIGGSSKRVKELQFIFSCPPGYGRNLEWEKEGYHVHDAASLLRRYLNSLPEPLVPLALYEEFRLPIMRRENLQARLRKTGTRKTKGEAGVAVEEEEVTIDEALAIKRDLLTEINGALTDYKILLQKLPPTNKQMILYLLDMLNLFALNCKTNLMHAKNLAAIFQPSLLSHPDHDLDPSEYDNSRPVVEFLIQYADRLLPNVTTNRVSGTESVEADESRSVTPEVGGNRRHSKSLPSRNEHTEIIQHIRSGLQIDRLLDPEGAPEAEVREPANVAARKLKDLLGELMTAPGGAPKSASVPGPVFTAKKFVPHGALVPVSEPSPFLVPRAPDSTLTTPVIEGESPVIEGESPVIEGESPVVEGESPVVIDHLPAIMADAPIFTIDAPGSAPQDASPSTVHTTPT